jgi:hypothetical protein
MIPCNTLSGHPLSVAASETEKGWNDMFDALAAALVIIQST